jgi:cytochrome c oxidase subunit 4
MSDHVHLNPGHEAIAVHAGHHDEHVHVVPVWILLAVFASLLVLTVITVAVVQVDLGRLNIWIAMGVATIKATLVALYFMHLRYDNKFNMLIFLACFLFVALFVGFAMMDSKEYQPLIRARQAALKSY